MDSFLALGIAVAAAAIVLPSAAWCWYQWSHRRLIAAASALPSVLPTLPLLGHLRHLVKTSLGTMTSILDLFRHPKFFTTSLWIGPVPCIIISRPEDVQKILSSSKALQKPSEYDLMNFITGASGLLSAPVHIWKRTRREITPIFQHRNLQHIVPTLNMTGRELVMNLSQHVGQGHLNVLPPILHMALCNIFSLMFGPDAHIDYKSDEFKETLENVECIGDIVFSRICYIWLRWKGVFTFVYRRFLQREEKVWRSTLWSILSKKLQEKKIQMQQDKTIENVTECTTFPDMFHNLREADPRFGESYMREEILTFLGTGVESVSLTMSACLVALGTHLDVQEKLYEDIVQLVGDSWQDLTTEDIDRMTYLDQVLKETLRRFVIIPVIGRKSIEDSHLRDCTIPADSTVLISIAALNYNPDIFPEPEKFDPNRFSPENVAKMDKYSFLPFSKGPRDCIGKQYGMIQMKITLAHLIREYKIYSDMNIDKMRFSYALALRSEDGYIIRLEKRKR